ncbi:hypothetical protein FRC16_005183 [Serendipita sp. 398]|nr:hypothetical protein FRC16_005183 [Serendipita sp. 398]
MSTKVPDDWNREQDDLVNHDRLRQAIPPPKSKIKDDWDDEDEDEDVENTDLRPSLTARPNNVGAQSERESETISSQSISRLLQPKPAVPSNYTNIGSSFPPELSLEPQVRILKRPKASQPSSQSPSPVQNERQRLQEREDKYRLARERIFGSSPSESSLNSNPSSPRTVAVSEVLQSTDPSRPQKRGTNKETNNDEIQAIVRPVREPLGPGTRPSFARKTETSRRVIPQEEAKEDGAPQNA